jgi:hypothetical protein
MCLHRQKESETTEIEEHPDNGSETTTPINERENKLVFLLTAIL